MKKRVFIALITLFISGLSSSPGEEVNLEGAVNPILVESNGSVVDEQQTVDRVQTVASNQTFWQEMKNGLIGLFVKFRGEKYSLEEHPTAIIDFNMKFTSEGKTIIDEETYEMYSRKDSKFRSLGSLKKMFKKEHGSMEGFDSFLFSKSDYYTLREVPNVIVKLNRRSLESERLVDIPTYEKFRYKDPRLPSWIIVVTKYVAENGTIEGLVKFIFREPKQPKPKLYDLKEVPRAVARLNTRSPKAEQITNIKTYKEFYDGDPRLPSWSTLVRWYTKIHGNSRGLLDFVLNKKCSKVFSAA